MATQPCPFLILNLPGPSIDTKGPTELVNLTLIERLSPSGPHDTTVHFASGRMQSYGIDPIALFDAVLNAKTWTAKGQAEVNGCRVELPRRERAPTPPAEPVADTTDDVDDAPPVHHPESDDAPPADPAADPAWPGNVIDASYEEDDTPAAPPADPAI
jgi:hypothetical protein